MQKIIQVAFLVGVFSLGMGCVQSESDSEKLPVRYTVVVTERASGAPLAGVLIELQSEDGREHSLRTPSSGRVNFPEIRSYQNQFLLTREGFTPADSIDFPAVPDSTTQVILRIMQFSMESLTDTNEALPGMTSLSLSILSDGAGEPLSQSQIRVLDGTKPMRALVSDSTGRVLIDSLQGPGTLLQVSRAGYSPLDTVLALSPVAVGETVFRALRVYLTPIPVDSADAP